MGLGKNGQRDASLLALKMKERGHEARYVGGLWKLEKQGNIISPRASRRAHNPANSLILV